MLLQNYSSAMLTFMSAERKSVNIHKALSWLLIASILLVTFLPAHYHLHHLYDDNTFNVAATAHTHVIDLHVLSDDIGQSHHSDEATSIAVTPDGIRKNSHPDFFPFILLTILLLLVHTLSKRINILLCHITTGHKKHHPYFTPLLRAPPLI